MKLCATLLVLELTGSKSSLNGSYNDYYGKSITRNSWVQITALPLALWVTLDKPYHSKMGVITPCIGGGVPMRIPRGEERKHCIVVLEQSGAYVHILLVPLLAAV